MPCPKNASAFSCLAGGWCRGRCHRNAVPRRYFSAWPGWHPTQSDSIPADSSLRANHRPPAFYPASGARYSHWEVIRHTHTYKQRTGSAWRPRHHRQQEPRTAATARTAACHRIRSHSTVSKQSQLAKKARRSVNTRNCYRCFEDRDQSNGTPWSTSILVEKDKNDRLSFPLTDSGCFSRESNAAMRSLCWRALRKVVFISFLHAMTLCACLYSHHTDAIVTSPKMIN